MELRHLRYFVAVAEELHFGRAAERLHIAQPPLSQQIKQLESELEVSLFSRSTRRVELTPEGDSFLADARKILADADLAAAHARAIAAGNAGRVAIGFTGSATYELLPALARLLRQDVPDLHLDLKGEMLTPDQVAGLLDRSLDIGFLRPPIRSAEIEARVLRREPLIAVLPEFHPLSRVKNLELSQLEGEPFVTYPARHRSVVYEAVIDTCESAGFTPASQTEVAETSTLVSFVAAGLGVALVPASVQHLAVTGAVYRTLASRTQEVVLAVATRREPLSPQVRRVVESIGKLNIGQIFDR